MIKIDWRRYIRNRQWFGWWYRYPHVEISNSPLVGYWVREPEKKWHRVPVVLVASTFENFVGPDDSASSWRKNYDLI